jgi:uncharacterized protein YbbK (DUF523 family)
MKIVSACLVGINCRFDGRNKSKQELIEAFQRGGLVPLCPEQLGGLPTPRPPSRIVNGDGYDVLAGKARVINEKSEDVTENFTNGAEKVLNIVRILDGEEAILESKSPSCGCGRICGEAFGAFMHGDGVLTALLKTNGVRVVPK